VLSEEMKETGFHVDINDPRNTNVLAKLKDMKTKKLKEFLMRDAFYPLYDVDSIRHRLLRIRQTNGDLTSMKIPLLIDEILNIDIFMKAIEVLSLMRSLCEMSSCIV
jgi:hypothetical protein